MTMKLSTKTLPRMLREEASELVISLPQNFQPTLGIGMMTQN